VNIDPFHLGAREIRLFPSCRLRPLPFSLNRIIEGLRRILHRVPSRRFSSFFFVSIRGRVFFLFPLPVFVSELSSDSARFVVFPPCFLSFFCGRTLFFRRNKLLFPPFLGIVVPPSFRAFLSPSCFFWFLSPSIFAKGPLFSSFCLAPVEALLSSQICFFFVAVLFSLFLFYANFRTVLMLCDIGLAVGPSLFS